MVVLTLTTEEAGAVREELGEYLNMLLGFLAQRKPLSPAERRRMELLKGVLQKLKAADRL